MSRRPTAYRPPRDRREVVTASLVVLAIVVFTAVMVIVFAPSDDTPATPSTPTTLPGATTTFPGGTVPPDTSVTTVPGIPTTAATPAPTG